MKKMLFLLAFLVVVGQSFGQNNRRPVHDKDYYLERSARLRTPAFILLGAGAVATTAGILIIHNNENSNNFDNAVGGIFAGLALTIAGTASIIGSIPLLAISGAMKRKAARLSFNNRNILLPAQNSFVARAQPTLTFSIRL